MILPDESGVSGQQTWVVRGSVSPVFNHTMVYDGLQFIDLTQACAEITVWNSSTCLGGVHLSSGSGTAGYRCIHRYTQICFYVFTSRTLAAYQYTLSDNVQALLEGNSNL